MNADPKQLQELLDDFRIDELLSLVSLEEIAAAWCGYHTRPHISGIEDEDPESTKIVCSGWSYVRRSRSGSRGAPTGLGLGSAA